MQKRVHLVDLGESFPTSIYLLKSASIQPRTSPAKICKKFIKFCKILKKFVKFCKICQFLFQKFWQFFGIFKRKNCLDFFGIFKKKCLKMFWNFFATEQSPLPHDGAERPRRHSKKAPTSTFLGSKQRQKVARVATSGAEIDQNSEKRFF